MSDELYEFLISGDLVRLIDGLEVTDIQFLYSTTNNYYQADEQYGNVITVAKTGSSFTTINSALEAIVDNNTNNRYLIQISPDLYVEDIVMKPFVTIQGISSYARIQGKITVNFTGVTNSTRLDNIELKNYNAETLNIDTDGIVIFNDVAIKTYYTVASGTRVKCMFNIKQGIINIVGASTTTFMNTVSGTTNNIDTTFYVNGTGVTNLIGLNLGTQITTYEQNTYVSVVYNENINTLTNIEIKGANVYYYLYNSNPANFIVPIIHSGATNVSSLSTTRFYTEAPNNSNGLKLMPAYNTNSYIVESAIYCNYDSFTWNNSEISDDSVYMGAAITVLDSVRVINCFFRTGGDTIPHRYDVDGAIGDIFYSINNNEGTQANYGQIRTSSLYIGTDVSASGGTIIDRILNEENLISDSTTALPTQHSVKKYIDDTVSGISSTSFVTNIVFSAYTGMTGLQEITEINAETDIESSFDGGLVVQKIRPSGDTTTAIQINKTDGVTPIITINTVSGFTGHGVVNPFGLVHAYGTDNQGSEIGTQTNALIIDGAPDVDKDVAWFEDGEPKWLAETYRNEQSDFWYLYNVEADNSLLTIMETGRIGVNKQTNFVDYHPVMVVNGGPNDLITGGVYTQNYNTIYELEISSTGVTDNYHWRTSLDNGITYGSWSDETGCTLTEVELEYGVTVYFMSVSGHSVGQMWRFAAFSQIPQATFTIAPMSIKQVQKTEDFTGDPIIYQDLTSLSNGGIAGQTFILFETGTTSTIQSLYLGFVVEVNSIYIDLSIVGESIILVTEYWDGVDWIALTFNNNNYIDGTENLIKSGKIIWTPDTMIGWSRLNIPDLPGDENNLLWIRFRTSSNPTIAPVAYSLSIGNDKRFSVYNAFNDYRPSFYVDARGRVNIGGGNITRDNRLQINEGNSLDVAVGSGSIFETDATDPLVADHRIKLVSDDSYGAGIVFVKTRGILESTTTVLNGDELGHIWWRAKVGTSPTTGVTLASIEARYMGDGIYTSLKGDIIFSTADGTPLPTERVRITSSGYTGFGVIPTAYIHITSGDTSVAPLKFTSGSLLSSPQVGAIEFLTDAFYGTITSGTERKTFAFLESPQFIDAPNLPSGSTLIGMNLYDFIVTSGGSSSSYHVSKTEYDTYTGTTAPNTYVTKIVYDIFTGTTGLNEITQINAYTNIDTLFNSGITTTQIRATNSETINIKDYLGNTKVTFLTDSGLTGFGTTGATNQVHIFGHDTTGDVLGVQSNGIMIDGDIGTDKQIAWKTRGTVKWLAETYRNENGKFWYLWSQENNSAPIVASQGGRIGINNPSNIMNYHILKTVGEGEGLSIGGLYDKNFLLVYQVQINSTTGTTDTFIWRTSKNYGDTYGSWSIESGCSSTPFIFSNGIELAFDSETGNIIGDTWEFGAFPQLPLGTFVVTPVEFNEVLKTSDYTGTIVYEDVTSFTQSANPIYTTSLLLTGTTNSAFTLISEYWDGNQWNDISIGSDYYIDDTNNLSNSGQIVWDSTILTGWVASYMTDKVEDGYELFWMRFRSVSNPSIVPIVNNVVRNGDKRFAVNTAPLSYRPEFYIDSLGSNWWTK